jgi:SET domain-containing protein
MKKPPHEGVFTRLKPSPIHGIGVFAIRRIPKGTRVFGADDAALAWVPKKQIEHLPEPLKMLYTDFSVIKGDWYGCPTSFNDLTVSWYLNHSENPNVAADDSFRFYALRDIEEGEELTVNYQTYSDTP